MVLQEEIDALLRKYTQGMVPNTSVSDCVTQKILMYYFILQLDICIDIYNKGGFSK